MDANFLISGLIIAAVVILLVYYFAGRFSGEENDEKKYIEALEYMLDGNDRLAMEKLKALVKKNTDHVQAYIYLGKILRSQGLVKNAARIHQELTYRGNLTEHQRISIIRELILDHCELKNWDRIIELAQKYPAAGKDHAVLERIMQAFEKKKAWEKGAEFLKNLKSSDPLVKKKIALYLVFHGLEVADRKSGHDGRYILKEALKYDEKCVPAYFSIAQTYFDEERLKDAIFFLKELALKVPEHCYYAFKPLEDIYWQQNEFPKIQSFYEELVEKYPELIYPYLALANLFAKKGNVNKAVQILTGFLNEHPQVKGEGEKYLFGFYLKAGDRDKALQLAAELMKINVDNIFSNLRCRKCNFVTTEPLWICPSCDALMSFTL